MVAVVVLLLIISWFLYLVYQRLMPSAPPSAMPTAVEVTPAQYQNIPVTVNAIGSLAAPQSTMLKAQVGGVVTNIAFKNGQNVVEGQLLIQLDNAEYQAMYQKAWATMSVAKITYDRYEALEKEAPDALSKLQVDQVYSTYKESEAALAAAAKQLSNMQIRAPFNGVVGSTTLAVGSYVNQGDQLVAVVNRKILEITYNLPESYYGEVKLGQKVSFTSDAYPGITFGALVDYIAPLVSQQNRAFSVRALVGEHAEQLSPGMLVNLTQVLNPSNRILAVPALSLVADMSGYAVYTIEGGKVLSLPVQIGARFGDWVAVTSGVTAGASIISAGQEKVQPGSSVTVIDSGS